MSVEAPAACPRCSDGPVEQHVVTATGERWWVCEECEAVWDALEAPRAPGFEDLGSLLRARGLPPTWDQLRAPSAADPDPDAVLATAIERTRSDDPAERAAGAAAAAPAALSGGTSGRLRELLADEPVVARAAAVGLLRHGDDADADAVADALGADALRDAVEEAGRDRSFTAHRLQERFGG